MIYLQISLTFFLELLRRNFARCFQYVYADSQNIFDSQSEHVV